MGRAITRVISPLIDPSFQPLSLGWRPKMDRCRALAWALSQSEDCGYWCWVVDDVANAFDQIPRSRLSDALEPWLPRKVMSLLKSWMGGWEGRGVLQGLPDSPLWANVFFDKFLDRPWYRDPGDQPLIRFGDDVLVLTPTPEVARRAHRRLDQLACSAGTPLKGGTTAGVRNLAAGEQVDWLGYRITTHHGVPVVRLAPVALDQLAMRLDEHHRDPMGPLRVLQTLKGWIDQVGPCVAAEGARALAGRVRAVAIDAGFDELPSEDRLTQVASASSARWVKTLKKVKKQLPWLREELKAYPDHRPPAFDEPEPDPPPDPDFLQLMPEWWRDCQNPDAAAI